MVKLSYFLFFSIFLWLSNGVAFSQAKPTATRSLSPSAFLLVGGSYTGLGPNSSPTVFHGGKNLLMTAGLDLGFLSFGHYVVGAEVRGSLPVNSGNLVGEKAILGGARLSYQSNFPLRPYIDVLAGRGQMNYQRGGYIANNNLYRQTAGSVFGGGVGVEWDTFHQVSLKIEAQAQQWGTPAVDRGFVRSVQGNIGVAYRFGTGRAPR